MYIEVNREVVFPDPKIYWEAKTSNSERDLRIKQLALGIIALINFGAVGTGLYFAIPYILQIPAAPVALIAIMWGFMSALGNLGYPKTSGNFSMSTNVTIGKGLAYLVFGPLKLAIKHCDWTTYHKKRTAIAVGDLIANGKFETFADNHGPHIKNCLKYRVMYCRSEETKNELLNLYKDYCELKKLDIQDYETTLCERKKEIETRWEGLRSHIRCYNTPIER